VREMAEALCLEELPQRLDERAGVLARTAREGRPGRFPALGWEGTRPAQRVSQELVSADEAGRTSVLLPPKATSRLGARRETGKVFPRQRAGVEEPASLELRESLDQGWRPSDPSAPRVSIRVRFGRSPPGENSNEDPGNGPENGTRGGPRSSEARIQGPEEGPEENESRPFWPSSPACGTSDRGRDPREPRGARALRALGASRLGRWSPPGWEGTRPAQRERETKGFSRAGSRVEPRFCLRQRRPRSSAQDGRPGRFSCAKEPASRSSKGSFRARTTRRDLRPESLGLRIETDAKSTVSEISPR